MGTVTTYRYPRLTKLLGQDVLDDCIDAVLDMSVYVHLGLVEMPRPVTQSVEVTQ